MDNVINKLSRDSIDYDYSLDFKGLKIKDKADDGTEYHKPYIIWSIKQL